MSHSWHDSREAKWDALRAWGERDVVDRGGESLLWLDAASVSRDMPLERSLALLPLYLAGVQRMIVLAGPTCKAGSLESGWP